MKTEAFVKKLKIRYIASQLLLITDLTIQPHLLLQTAVTYMHLTQMRITLKNILPLSQKNYCKIQMSIIRIAHLMRTIKYMG